MNIQIKWNKPNFKNSILHHSIQEHTKLTYGDKKINLAVAMIVSQRLYTEENIKFGDSNHGCILFFKKVLMNVYAFLKDQEPTHLQYINLVVC